jgi:hypothetical protein
MHREYTCDVVNNIDDSHVDYVSTLASIGKRGDMGVMHEKFDLFIVSI